MAGDRRLRRQHHHARAEAAGQATKFYEKRQKTSTSDTTACAQKQKKGTRCGCPLVEVKAFLKILWPKFRVTDRAEYVGAQSCVAPLPSDSTATIYLKCSGNGFPAERLAAVVFVVGEIKHLSEIVDGRICIAG
jgi:hypothetical protein